MKDMWKEFKEFINKGDIVMIAVALVMALYFKAIVDQVIAGVITRSSPPSSASPAYESIGFDIGDAFISIGLVIDAVIDFVVVAIVLFFIVKAYNHWKQSEDEEAGPTEIELLTDIRDSLRQR